MSITIDKEFESLIPPLSPEEFQQLEENCVKEGIRDALVVWNQDGDDILVDGHNRFKIVGKHPTLQFKIHRMDFADRNEAKLWVLKNQMGRRNISTYTRATLALKMKPLIADAAKTRMTLAPQKSAERKKKLKKIWDSYDYDVARNLVAMKKQKFAKEDRCESMAEAKYIYFARFGGDKLKIGSSYDPEARVKQLSVSCPGIEIVETVHFGKGSEKHEQALSKKFSKYKIGNECYQCSDDVLGEMIAFTKKERTRKDSTAEIISQIAGVSHDTIHKVEAIQNSGNQQLIDDVREGRESINSGYQRVHPKKTPAQSNKEFIEQAKQEHEAFQNNKTVSIHEAQMDKANRQILASNLYSRLLNMGLRINDVAHDMEEGDINIKEMCKELDKARIKSLKLTIRTTYEQLMKIDKELNIG